MIIKGSILGSYSEPINGAPVMVRIQTENGIVAIPFEREYYNEFVGDGIDVGHNVTARLDIGQYASFVEEEELDRYGEWLFDQHKERGEPLDGAEVSAIVAAGIANEDEFDQRGGGLYWHSQTHPDQDE